jgi:regulator of protease activity HflC (stomatin/prohibitin superfamily)
MKKLLTFALTMLTMLFLTGCENVPAGFVAVKVDRYGDSRGVQNEVVGPGRYFAGPNTDYFMFPGFSQNEVWAHTKDHDQSITFQDKDGQLFNADFGMTYSIKRENASQVFQKYRKGIEEISDRFLRNMLRDALNEQASTKTAGELMSDKIVFMKSVEKQVIDLASKSGISVESISVIGGFRPPEKIVNSINAKLIATQEAMQVENELRKTKAQAEKDVAKAEAEVRVAKAEAEAIALKGAALDRNPGVLKQQWIEKWDGKLSGVVTGQNQPVILNLDK